MGKPDYDSTIARIAGNIASGMVHGNWDKESVARTSVEVARAIVEETKKSIPPPKRQCDHLECPGSWCEGALSEKDGNYAR